MNGILQCVNRRRTLKGQRLDAFQTEECTITIQALPDGSPESGEKVLPVV